MEFLDPEEKRSKSIRLMVGYCLAGAVVILGTFIISFVLQGFTLFQRQSAVRNGLLFVSSSPTGAKISINNDNDKTTDARFVIPEGSYNLSLKKDGYRDWSKLVKIIGGSVHYHVYPKLYPTDIKESIVASVDSAPPIWTQSPDKRWIIYAQVSDVVSFKQIDTTSNQSPVDLAVPATVFAPNILEGSSLQVVEWSDDSRHLLISAKYSSGVVGYYIIDRQSPAESINLSQQLSLSQFSQVRLRNKKYNQYYVLDGSTKILRKASLGGGIESQVLKDGVVSYEPYGSDGILCVTETSSMPTDYSVVIISGGTDSLLRPVKRSDAIYLDVGKYRGEWVLAVGSKSQSQADIYINPLASSGKALDGVIQPAHTLNLDNADSLSFSDNARFIGLSSSDSIAVFDFETEEGYAYSSPTGLGGGKISWADGHRMQFNSAGFVNVFEFDGENSQKLVSSVEVLVAFFDKNQDRIYTIKPSDNGYGLWLGNLIVSSAQPR